MHASEDDGFTDDRGSRLSTHAGVPRRNQPGSQIVWRSRAYPTALQTVKERGDGGAEASWTRSLPSRCTKVDESHSHRSEACTGRTGHMWVGVVAALCCCTTSSRWVGKKILMLKSQGRTCLLPTSVPWPHRYRKTSMSMDEPVIRRQFAWAMPMPTLVRLACRIIEPGFRYSPTTTSNSGAAAVISCST
jgi:hypothetical protein